MFAYLYKLCVRVSVQRTRRHIARLQDPDAAASILPDLRDCLATFSQNGSHLQRSRQCLCEPDCRDKPNIRKLSATKLPRYNEDAEIPLGNWASMTARCECQAMTSRYDNRRKEAQCVAETQHANLAPIRRICMLTWLSSSELIKGGQCR